MARLNSFEELGCWKACRQLKHFVFSLLKGFPKEEVFLLTAQLKDSSRSTTHNIAEGFGRHLAMDNARFCRVARGSLMEVLDQMITANDEGLITDLELKKGRELFQLALSPLDGYIDYLTKGRQGNELREPLDEYHKNGTYHSEDVAAEVFQPYNSSPASTSEQLSAPK